VQTEVDEDEEDIDRDIGYFKGLTPGAQDKLLSKLKTKVEPAEPAVPLKFQIMAKEVPPEMERVALAKYNALINIDPSSTEYYKASQWLHGYTQLPLGIYKDLPVKLEDGQEACQNFVAGVRKQMEAAMSLGAYWVSAWWEVEWVRWKGPVLMAFGSVFGGCLGEVGAVTLFASDQWVSLPLLISRSMQRYHFGQAQTLAALLLGCVFVITLGANEIGQRISRTKS
jgi:hypothetical protein